MINESEIQQQLRDLIKENPTLPFKIFAADDVNSGEFRYEESYISSVKIDEIALLEERWEATWYNKEDYPDELYDYLKYTKEYKGEELEAKYKEEFAKVKFEKFIVINIG
ncbi:hypothetical protein ACFO6R_13375 [Eubacterium multiforme]|uniref:Uncharacterized protein n=1 Tax=Eubacterium multiforme TaxID=83339 RepID=A0ABT9UY30_9FIRM|nr:hypothetical protein [Eubacterium multiforme]MDQ0151164.1 hypothetical protein [Eubacterium multiforme]